MLPVTGNNWSNFIDSPVANRSPIGTVFKLKIYIVRAGRSPLSETGFG